MAMIRSGYSSRILLMRRVPRPEPVPPPREWVSWKPVERVGGWVGGWLEEKEVIGMGCCKTRVGRVGGGEGGGWNELL